MRDDTPKLNIPRSAKRYLGLRGLSGMTSPGRVDLYIKASADILNQGDTRFRNKTAARGPGLAKKVVEALLSADGDFERIRLAGQLS